MKNENQKIKCKVESCDYQDCDCCTLEEIEVGCTCEATEATEQEETVCRSFKCDKNSIEEE